MLWYLDTGLLTQYIISVNKIYVGQLLFRANHVTGRKRGGKVLSDMPNKGQKALVTYGQKVTSSRMLRHSAWVTRLTAPPHQLCYLTSSGKEGGVQYEIF